MWITVATLSRFSKRCSWSSCKTIIPWAVRLSWLENIYSRPFLTNKVGQTDLVVGVRPLVGLQDYKCLCAAVTICSTLVNIPTHIRTQRQHFNELKYTSNVTTVSEIRSASIGLVLHVHHIFAKSFTFRLIFSSPEGYRLQFFIPRVYFVCTVWYCTGQHCSSVYSFKYRLFAGTWRP